MRCSVGSGGIVVRMEYVEPYHILQKSVSGMAAFGDRRWKA
jgi:hypothetical protein